MKNFGVSSHQNRFVQLYHPYYSAPRYQTKNYNDFPDFTDNTTNNFVNGGLYESEGESDYFPGSPFSNPDPQTNTNNFAEMDDLNTIDFSDLFNIQKHEQEEEPMQNNQLQILLDQVRRESMASLDSLDNNYCYDISPAHTPDSSCYAVKEEFSYPSPNSYVSTTEEFSFPSPNSYIKEEPQFVATIPTPTNKCYTQLQQPTYQCEEYKPVKQQTKSPKPSTPTSPPRRGSLHNDDNDKIRLYEFVLQLLNEDRTECIRWLCPIDGEFEITNSAKIAQLWGEVKKNPTMTYEKFARALRHYYKLGILVNYKHKEKLRYKFSQEILLKNKKALETTTNDMQ